MEGRENKPVLAEDAIHFTESRMEFDALKMNQRIERSDARETCIAEA
jgi:hypothetical protein